MSAPEDISAIATFQLGQRVRYAGKEGTVVKIDRKECTVGVRFSSLTEDDVTAEMVDKAHAFAHVEA